MCFPIKTIHIDLVQRGGSTTNRCPVSHVASRSVHRGFALLHPGFGTASGDLERSFRIDVARDGLKSSVERKHSSNYINCVFLLGSIATYIYKYIYLYIGVYIYINNMYVCNVRQCNVM